MKIEKEALIFIDMLSNSGYEAWFVGGFVRDSIMKKECYDIDITTNATPEEVKKVFDGFNVIETGIKHGTVTVIIGKTSAEITTYRTDNSYKDNRHPETVTFCRTLHEDLSRRDFTVNAIAFNPQKGYTDLFGGYADISKKVIRCIGSAQKRFEEDALRILRALRFASVLGFEIEEKTAKAIHNSKNLLLNISSERIFSELKKILCGKNIRKILVDYIDVFVVVLPELENMEGFEQYNFHHKYDVLMHTAVVVENSPPDPILRLSALFHDCGKPDCFSVDENGTGHFYGHASISAKKARNALHRLKADNFTTDRVDKLVRIHDTPIEESEKAVRKKLGRYGEEVFDSLIMLQRADTLGLADEFRSRLAHFEKLKQIKEEIIRQNQCFSLKSLAVDGRDIVNLGFKGKKIGEALKFLLESVVDEKTENEKEKLIEYLLDYFTP